MEITGAILIGESETRTQRTFEAIDPATGTPIGPAISEAGASHVAAAAALANSAFASFSELAPSLRAGFLETIADSIDGLGDALIERAMRESGLPRARLEGERARTIGQLRLFADVVREGAWMHLVIDEALPDRAPLPRPDLRRRHVALGPVAVFGASNFPLAFSVAGGDTASALAAGCPVIVKGHPAHPGTGELVARAVRQAVAACGLHPGVFSYLPGSSHDLGATLVADPRVKAVGFTGSRSGGQALVTVASNRPEPIPIYAEMSSINPVILFPAAARARGAALGADYVASLTMGAGQFCTNPGLVLALAGTDHEAFVAAAAAALAGQAAQTMLTPGIHAAYERGVAALAGHPQVTTVARGSEAAGPAACRPALFQTTAASFRADHTLGAEVFGASSLVVTAADLDEVGRIIDGLEGQLTATLLFDPEDEPLVAPIVARLARRCGRILANGWPTGVEVCHAMVHGGPWPATSDSRTTSVGTLAIERFLRPVCYQNLPDRLLPEPLRAANPWQAPRRLNGRMQQG